MSDNEVSVLDRANLPSIKTVEETGLANFGNNVLTALIRQVAFEDELSELQEAADSTRGLISFELTKAIVKLMEENEKINIYAIWEGGRSVEKLNTRVLVAMGVMTRVADEESDSVIYKWSDPDNEKQYNYGGVDKEKEKDEYNRRLNNRKRLNIALSNAYKAAITLIDGGTKADDLVIVKEEGQAPVATINNAPKAIAGEVEGGKVEFGKRTVNTGASHSPTMASLVKIATQKHKIEDEGKTGERSDKGNDRSGDAKIAMTDEAFGGMVNNLKRAIAAQEGKFTVDMLKQVASLIPVLQETAKLKPTAPTPTAPAKEEVKPAESKVAGGTKKTAKK